MAAKEAKNRQFKTSYADFSLTRSIHQLFYLLRQKHDASAEALLEWVKMDEARLEEALDVPAIADKQVLEIGPGQNMERAWYYGIKNKVTGIDLDVLPIGFDIPGYFKMWRTNGFGRFAKTAGRNLLINPRQSRAWAKAIGVDQPSRPEMYFDDVCSPTVGDRVPGFGAYDVVMSWSVFEHLPDPKTALENVVKALKPGGALLISLHLYTSNNGHHDIRGFTGKIDELPLWAHLRPNHRHQISPSSYLNEWRLPRWRDLFFELTPGCREFLDQYEHPEVYGPKITGSLKEELKDFEFDELVTVNLVYTWRKPMM